MKRIFLTKSITWDMMGPLLTIRRTLGIMDAHLKISKIEIRNLVVVVKRLGGWPFKSVRGLQRTQGGYRWKVTPFLLKQEH